MLMTLIPGLILLVMAAVMGFIIHRAVGSGEVPPFRMNRWSKPDPVYRDESPGMFWFWVACYGVFGVGALVCSLLAMLGRLPLK